ncbi:MAG: hypothetical protein CAPSK01_001962 [Candidatus Accumulibacter vicinus]|uniref:Uncharacterized protein n=1 Tax=Candidatus Accumulibacter vicinus TaxID=2954382 RepID=A0A084Y1H2_9PROT|nr:MAG: hypothetical protein CAPSK01_001962 [Candidatus Accumulibacter vicinus]
MADAGRQRRIGVDDRQLDSLASEIAHHGLPESAVAADHPVAGRRVVALGNLLTRQAGQQVDQAKPVRRVDRLRQVVGELFKVVDDVVRAKGHHVGLDRRTGDAGDDAQPRIDQAAGDGDGQIGRVVVGHRQHAAAAPMLQSGHQEVLRLRRVGAQDEDVGREVLQFEFLDARLGALDGDDANSVVVQRPGDQQAGLATAADDVEGFAELADAAREAAGQQHLLEALVLHQRQQADDRVRPADDREVDRRRHPHPLGIGKGVRQLAETDRRRRVADEVEGVEEAHRRRRPAFGVDPGHQRQAERRHRVDDDQDDQRRAHAPQGEKQDAGVHRGAAVSAAASRFRQSAGRPRRRWRTARHRSARRRWW